MDKMITVIIPCHNATKTLPRAWDSLRKQTIGLQSLECIFADDASDDDGATWQMLESFEAQSPDSVILLRLDQNLRQGGARNAAMEYASGRYLMFLDADDELRHDACEALYREAVENNADLIQFRHRFLRDDDSGLPVPREKAPQGRRLCCLTDDSVRESFLTGTIATFGCTNKCYRLKLVRQTASRFAERRVYEEPKFVYPLFLYAEHVLMTDDDYYFYHWHADSTMTSRLGERLLDHPAVQLELLEDLMKRPEMFERYHTEIEAQFIFSFYCETILFTGINRGMLPLDYFHEMQSVCNSLFPDATDNRYLNHMRNAVPLLPSLHRRFSSQDDLNGYIVSSVRETQRSG